MAAVTLTNIRKAYGRDEVLHGIGVDVADGEFVVLVGPSGCGKSTLLRVLAGLETIGEGSILIDGVEVNDVQPKDRDIAMVFQNYALYPQMTVAENMGFSLRMAKAEKREARATVERAADILGLGELLGRYPRQLSGGQRQRVAIGRAIVRDPKVFLFDEPLSNLDAKLRVQMRTELKELHRRLGATIVYVTHDQIEAMSMADKIVVMRGGRVEQSGAPLELYDRPANTFVAGFIGSPAMNFVPARVEGTSVVVDDVVLPLGGSVPGGPREITLGIRPEDMLVGTGDIEASVVEIEPTGADTQLIARIGEHTVTATSHERLALSPDEAVRLGVAPGKLHLFERESGSAIGRL